MKKVTAALMKTDGGIALPAKMSGANDLITCFATNLRLLQRAGPSDSELKFTLDLLWAYLAAWYLGHLTAASPCINSGATTTPFYPYTLSATDLDGGSRAIGRAPGMGAYEAGNADVYGMLAFDGISALASAFGLLIGNFNIVGAP